MLLMKKKVLFVCIENACRSQMAEAIAKNMGIEAFSAGSAPALKANPLALSVISAMGITTSNSKPKSIDVFSKEEFDYVITMGCGDKCPQIKAKHRIIWDIEDPKGKPYDFFVKTFYAIRAKIEDLFGPVEK